MSQKVVSPWSATMIGVHDNANAHDYAKQVFKEESREINNYLKNVHHARKISHIQVNYSETVNKLNKLQSEQVAVEPSNIQPQPRKTPYDVSDSRQLKLSEYNARMSEFVKQERDINERKRDFNRETGRKAVLHEIMMGTGPIPKDILYPQKATHTQILAMTGTLKAPDANVVPPRMPRRRKWLGEGVGWDS